MARKSVMYKDAGVDIDEANRATARFKDLVKTTHNKYVLGNVGGFGGLYQLPAGYKVPVLVNSTDGVGTKLMVAIMSGKHDTVGECLVNHCVNDIAVMGAIPLTFQDYFGTGKLDANVVAEVVSGISRGCIANGCALTGGETAEMPGFYTSPTYDLVGNISGIVERRKIISPGTVKSGDVLIALPSTGLHTNGYSLARKLFFEKARYGVGSYITELGTTVGEELLKVHRSYLKGIRTLCKAQLLLGAAHITGGGITENLPRILTNGLTAVIFTSHWNVPPVFQMLQHIGNVPLADLRRTFNLGVGLILAVGQESVGRAMRLLKSIGEQPWLIGEVLKKKGDWPAVEYV